MKLENFRIEDTRIDLSIWMEERRQRKFELAVGGKDCWCFGDDQRGWQVADKQQFATSVSNIDHV